LSTTAKGVSIIQNCDICKKQSQYPIDEVLTFSVISTILLPDYRNISRNNLLECLEL